MKTSCQKSTHRREEKNNGVFKGVFFYLYITIYISLFTTQFNIFLSNQVEMGSQVKSINYFQEYIFAIDEFCKSIHNIFYLCFNVISKFLQLIL